MLRKLLYLSEPWVPYIQNGEQSFIHPMFIETLLSIILCTHGVYVGNTLEKKNNF